MNSPIEAPAYSPAQQEWLYYFMAYGLSGILTHWVNNGMKEEPFEITKLIGELTDKILK